MAKKTRSKTTRATAEAKSSKTGDIILFGALAGLGILYFTSRKDGEGLFGDLFPGGLNLQLPGFGLGGGAEGEGIVDQFKNWVYENVPDPLRGGLPGAEADSRGVYPGQPGGAAPGPGGGEGEAPRVPDNWLPTTYTQAGFYQTEALRVGGIVGRQVVGRAIVGSKPYLRAGKVATSTIRDLVKSAQKTGLRAVSEVAPDLAPRTVASAAARASAKTAERVAAEAAEKAALRGGARVAAGVAEQSLIKGAAKGATKVAGKLGTKAIPIIGWASLFADVGADVARLFGADVTEWLGLSSLAEPVLGYNPLERWVAKTSGKTAQASIPEAPSSQVITPSYFVEPRPKQESRAVPEYIAPSWENNFPEYSSAEYQAATGGWYDQYIPTPITVTKPVTKTPVVSTKKEEPFADLGKYLPGRWGAESLERARESS